MTSVGAAGYRSESSLARAGGPRSSIMEPIAGTPPSSSLSFFIFISIFIFISLSLQCPNSFVATRTPVPPIQRKKEEGPEEIAKEIERVSILLYSIIYSFILSNVVIR